MDEDQRRKKRVVKLKKDSEFAYDDESIQFLNFGREVGQQQHQHEHLCSQDIGNIIEPVSEGISKVPGWSDIEFVYYNNPSHFNVEQGDIEGAYGLSDSQNPNTVLFSDESSVCFDKGGRNYSSTRLDFVDQYSILTVSPKSRLDSSDMGNDVLDVDGGNNSKCTCSEGKKDCAYCKSLEDGPSLKTLLTNALEKIDFLTNKVVKFEKTINEQNCRIRILETSGNSSGVVESSEPEHGRKNIDKYDTRSKSRKVNSKNVRVEEEKDRQLRVMQEKLRNKFSLEANTQTDESESEPDVNLMALRRKMTKKQKEKCGRKVTARLKQAGGIFPDEEFETSSSSGTDSSMTDKKRRSRKKVRSGAKIKKRPVIRTELWPHTIANEDDGEEVTSETIGLSKFLSSFTYIMVNCGKWEAKGRAALLHAVCLVFECLPWTDTRAFHNLIMLKLEQGYIDWASDFSELAGQYLEKRVRQSLRSRASATGGSRSNSNYNKSFGKGYGGSNRGRLGYNAWNSNKSRSLYAVVCKQWNYETCNYGDRCRKLHVCWSCAEAGKMGEQHKAPSHENSVPRTRPNSGV